MLTVGTIRKGALHKMREFSNSGEVNSTSDNTDYNVSVIPLINEFQMQLATNSSKVRKKISFFQNMPENALGVLNWNEDKIHAGGVVDTFTAYGAKGYSIQLAGQATVEIYEDDVFVSTFDHVPTSYDGYKTYKGLTGATTGKVELRLTGAYRHPYRWVALFTDEFYDANEVPKFEPYVPYIMPSDFYKLDQVVWSYQYRQLNDYQSFKMEYSNAEKQILIPWYDKGEFKINYFAYPTIIENVTISSSESKDNIALDVSDECMSYLINAVSAVLLRDENAYMSDMFQNLAEIDLARLSEDTTYDSGTKSVISISNW